MEELMKNNNIEIMIYKVRDVEVMMDFDLAIIYECKNGTKTINQAVKRNLEKFPSDFYFRLTDDEFNKICGPNLGPQKNMIRSLPYAFTEQGVAMLATVIKTPVATLISIRIMRAFVKMRHYIDYNNHLLPNRVLLLEEKVDNNSRRIDELFDKFDSKVISKDFLFFDGELFDAHMVLLNIFESSEKEIIIVDNYAGKEILNVLKDIKKKIIIVSSNINITLKNKYEKQYNNVTFIHNDTVHDRFIIIDRNKFYHCGASFKDLGKKCFGIHEFNDKKLLDEFLDRVIL